MHTQELIAILICLTALSSYLNYRYVKLPKSIGITLVTLSITLLLTLGGSLGWDVDNFSHALLNGISFNVTFLHGMLGFLLFAGSLHINSMELAKYKLIVATLATVSVVISTIIIGYAMYGLTQMLGIDLPFYYCFVFGALISPTDPIAVLGILKNVGASKSLESKIAGEALFNDGMGMVLFMVISAIAAGTSNALNVTEITIYFLQQTCGGLLFGWLLGYIMAKFLRTINDYEVAIIVTLAIVSGGYNVAESILHVSGPICMAVTGLIIGGSLKHGNMSIKTVTQLGEFWGLLDEILNAILFVLIGLESMRITFDLDIILASVGAIVIAIAARWISISIPVASLSRFRKFHPDVLIIMTWGGLRGGISIALALGIEGRFRDTIIGITYAVVLFSMIVQGLSLGHLIKRLSTKRHLKKTALHQQQITYQQKEERT